MSSNSHVGLKMEQMNPPDSSVRNGGDHTAVAADEGRLWGAAIPMQMTRTSSQDLKKLRKYQKRLLNHVTKNEADAAKELLEENTDLLNEKFASPYFKSILYIGRVDFERITIEETLYTIIDVGFRKLKNNADYLFFCAAKCEKEELKRLFKEIPPKDLNKVREGDTPLTFFIRFADYRNDNFIPCAEMLVGKLDVNIADYENCTPILKSCYLYSTRNGLNSWDDYKFRDAFSKLIKIILEKGNVDIDSHMLHEKTSRDYMNEYIPGVLLGFVVEEPSHPDAFALLKAKNERQFILVNISDHNIHDGENTLLQLACILNLPTAVSYLISRQAEINDTPGRNKDTPLEIAAKRGHSDIFDIVLNHINEINIDVGKRIVAAFENGEIDRNHFLKATERFVKGFVSDDGNTPLHYAVKLSSKESIHHFLNSGLHLLTKNYCNVCPLDCLNTDMANYAFNQFITRISTDDTESFIEFDYIALYSEERSQSDELTVLNEIAEKETLKQVLQHPLIKSYKQVHFQAVKNVLYFITIFYLACHLALFISHINYSSFSQSSDLALLDILWLSEILRAPMGLFRCRVAHQDKENQLYKLIAYEGTSFTCNLLTFPFIRSLPWNYRREISCVGILAMTFSLFQWLLYVPSLSRYIHMAERVVKNYFTIVITYSIIIVALGAISFALTKEPSIEPAQRSNQNCSIDFLPASASFPENISVTSSLNETCNCLCKTAARGNVTCSVLCNEVSDLKLLVLEDILDVYTDVMESSEAKWKSIRGWIIKVLFLFIFLIITAAISNLIQAVAFVDVQEVMDLSKLHELMSKLSFLRLSKRIRLPYIRPNVLKPPSSIRVNEEGKIVKPDEYKKFYLDSETLQEAKILISAEPFKRV